MNIKLENTYNGIAIRWFALISHYENMHADIYLKISGHSVEHLYLTTPLESLLNCSPLLIPLYKHDPIIDQLPKENTLYFSVLSDISTDKVLKHLRERLHVKFSGNRKGIFHYYLPSVASYFFALSDKSDNAKWLSYFTSLYLYKQIKSQSADWIKIEGGNQERQTSSPFWIITKSQELALNEKFHEQEISQWAEAENIKSIDWSRQKMVGPFCENYQINDEKLLKRIRDLIQRYDVSLNTLNFVPTQPNTPESIVKELETLMSREYENVY